MEQTSTKYCTAECSTKRSTTKSHGVKNPYSGKSTCQKSVLRAGVRTAIQSGITALGTGVRRVVRKK